MSRQGDWMRLKENKRYEQREPKNTFQLHVNHRSLLLQPEKFPLFQLEAGEG
jgi:hypothetical protein